MKKQFLLLALLATTVTTRPNDCPHEDSTQTKKNILEENIYKTSFLLGIASIASAISNGDNHITRGLSYAAASGFFIAPLANAYKSKKISNQVMLALSGLITGAAFINTANDFEHEEKRELLGSITTVLAGLCNIRSGRKSIYNALFGGLSFISGYKAYKAAHKIVYPQLAEFKPLEELLEETIDSSSEKLPFFNENLASIETRSSDFSLPSEESSNQD